MDRLVRLPINLHSKTVYEIRVRGEIAVSWLTGIGEVDAGVVREDVAKLHKQIFDHLADGDDCWHLSLPLFTPDPTQSYAVPLVGANLQNFS
jgi:hypothetical protein